MPRTLARSSAGGVARPGFPVEYVGVQWSDGGVGGRIRFADQAGRFGAWQQVGCGCAAGAGDGVVAPFGSALVPAGEATAYEVELASGGSTVALNTTAGPLTRVPLGAAAVSSQLAGLDFVSRAEWGADESLRFDETGAERYPQTYWPAQILTVHHTATQNNDPDPAARVRAIYRFHTIDQSFGDIGYHFLIDEAGRVYEGRFSGDDGTPGFDTAGRMMNAAHVGGFNAGNVGIALLGTFVDRAPTRAARTALTDLLAKIAGWVHLDPRATTTYVNPISGATRTVPTIPGHRDWAATECPGGFLYSALPPIRRDVDRLLRRSA